MNGRGAVALAVEKARLQGFSFGSKLPHTLLVGTTDIVFWVGMF